jgi:hypothetical protein
MADCLEYQFTPKALCIENHEWRVEARVQALPEGVDNNPPERIRPCDLEKLINSLKFIKDCAIDGTPNEVLMQFSKKTFVSFNALD